MAVLDLETNFGVQDKRMGRGLANSPWANEANFFDNASLDAALVAANGTYYTVARLNSMTKNDKVYALRTLQNPTGMMRG